MDLMYNQPNVEQMDLICKSNQFTIIRPYVPTLKACIAVERSKIVSVIVKLC